MIFVVHSAAIVLIALISHTVEGVAIHKELMISRAGFYKRERAQENMRHDVVILMVLPRMGELEEEVLRRSTPGNPMYQRWLTFDEVGSYLIDAAATDTVQAWLKENGASVDWLSPHHDVIRASAEISTWNDILDTTFYRYEDNDIDGRFLMNHTRSESYSIPYSMRGHIKAILHTSQPYPRLQKDPITVAKESLTPIDVDVAFINKYYNISNNIGDQRLSQSIFTTPTQYYALSDLNSFQQYYHLPIKDPIDDGYSSVDKCRFGLECFSAALAIEYIMGIAQNIESLVTYIAPATLSQDPFVAFVTNLATRSSPPSVVSIAWGSVEASLSPSIFDAFNTQAMKLAAMGVSLFVSSGDDGAVNAGCRSYSNDKISWSNKACVASSSSSTLPWFASVSQPWSGKGYFPSFPASSPWVTAVGATMGPNAGGPEVACQSSYGGLATSGGGFSMYNPTPSWQSKNVSAYFRSLPSKPAPGFNPKGRGYPDVSLIGVNYPVYSTEKWGYAFGTSASTPVFAAMVNLVNSVRKSAGFGTVGFINPTLYAAKSTLFKDITVGNNTCCSQDVNSGAPAHCCASGFVATTGWDPVTGLGSITYPDLLSILLAGLSNPPTSAPTLRPTSTSFPTGPTETPTVSPTRPTRQPTVAPTPYSPKNQGTSKSSTGSAYGYENIIFVVVYTVVGIAFVPLLYCCAKLYLIFRSHNDDHINPELQGLEQLEVDSDQCGILLATLPEAETVDVAEVRADVENTQHVGTYAEVDSETSGMRGTEGIIGRAQEVSISPALPVRAVPVAI